MMRAFDAPASVNGDALAAELHEAGIDVDSRSIRLVDGVLHIATDADASLVQQVIDAHVPPVLVDHDTAFRSAVAAATTIAQLRDALLGNAGPGAEPRRSPRETT